MALFVTQLHRYTCTDDNHREICFCKKKKNKLVARQIPCEIILQEGDLPKKKNLLKPSYTCTQCIKPHKAS